MLLRDFSKKIWLLADKKMTIKDNDEITILYTRDDNHLKELESMCESHGMGIVDIETLEYESDVKYRSNQIKDMPDGWSDIYNDYVFNGSLNKVNDLPLEHPMHMLSNKIIQNQQDELLLALAIEISKTKGDADV